MVYVVIELATCAQPVYAQLARCELDELLALQGALAALGIQIAVHVLSD